MSPGNEQTLITLGPYIGIDATTSQFFVDAQHAVDSINVVPNRKFEGLVTARGRTAFANAIPSNVTYEPVNIFKYQAVDKYFGIGSDSNIYEVASGGTPAKIVTGLTDITHGSFVEYETWAFFSNTTDTPIKIDTSLNVTNWGINSPTTAPTASVGSSGNLLGQYQYAVTFGNSTQESSPSPISGIVSPNAEEVNLNAIPTSTDPQVTQRNIYRIGGTLSQFQLIVVIDDNTTTTYTDNTADIYVTGQTLILHRDPPQSFYDLISFQDRIWGLGYKAQPSDVWYSNYKEPWGFDNTNQVIPCGRNPGDDIIVGGGVAGSILLILKQKSAYVITGSSEADYLANPAFSIGCCSKSSIAQAYGTLFWLHQTGVYMYNGQLQQISDRTQANCSIKGFLDNLAEADLAAAVGFVYQHIYYISFPTQQVTYGYSIDTGQWHKLSFYTTGATFDTSNFEVTAISQSGTQLLSWFAAENDLGNPIGSYYLSGIGDSQSPEITKQYVHLLCLAPIQSNAQAVVTLTINPGLQQIVLSQLFDLAIAPPRHLASLGPNASGFEAQIEVTMSTSAETEVQRISALGYAKRRLVVAG